MQAPSHGCTICRPCRSSDHRYATSESRECLHGVAGSQVSPQAALEAASTSLPLLLLQAGFRPNWSTQVPAPWVAPLPSRLRRRPRLMRYARSLNGLAPREMPAYLVEAEITIDFQLQLALYGHEEPRFFLRCPESSHCFRWCAGVWNATAVELGSRERLPVNTMGRTSVARRQRKRCAH